VFGKIIKCSDIGGKTLVLRPYDKEHATRMIDGVWINDPEISRYIISYLGHSREKQENWYDAAAASQNKYLWGIFYDGIHIGIADILDVNPVNHNAEYGILIGEREFWGKGIATEVAKVVADYGFNTLNLEHLYAEVILPNEGSKIALERAGYKEYGRKPGAAYIDGQYCTQWLAT
jgi:RimJ/RimL family protein N-acetyltransferase